VACSPHADYGARVRCARLSPRRVLPTSKNRLIVYPPRRCGSFVASRGPGGVALEPSAGLRVWLPNEVPAVRGLAVVWLERGVNARLSLIHI
jgi:hypothetical protein